METKKCRKNAEIYYCEKCNFTCSKKSNYIKHLNTAKHKMETTETKKCKKNALLNTCECGKKYSSPPINTIHRSLQNANVLM